MKVKGLWEQFDVSCKLEPEVNIFLGINGSGKSTLLKLIESIFSWNIKRILPYCDRLEVVCNDQQTFVFDWLSDQTSEAPFISFKHHENEWIKIEGQDQILTTETNDEIQFPFPPQINFSRLSTFDNELKEKEAIGKLTNDKILTELDWQIWQLEKEYLAYQLTIADRIEELLTHNTTSSFLEASQDIRKQKLRFEQLINLLFAKTGKSIDSNKNKEIIFKHQQGFEVSPYDLSSGEKQILVILLKVLLQDNQHHILMLDEPEISMHLSWQVDLIDFIKQLNPNCQLIIATHAPAVIKKGWKDKILKMDDLLIESN